MGQRNSDSSCRTSTAKRARRISLDDQQVGLVAEQGPQRRLHVAHVLVRVGLSGAAQVERGIIGQPMVPGIQQGMLAGEDKRRLKPPRGERVSDWS
jgi:hypothetical protein